MFSSTEREKRRMGERRKEEREGRRRENKKERGKRETRTERKRQTFSNVVYFLQTCQKVIPYQGKSICAFDQIISVSISQSINQSINQSNSHKEVKSDSSTMVDTAEGRSLWRRR